MTNGTLEIANSSLSEAFHIVVGARPRVRVCESPSGLASFQLIALIHVLSSFSLATIRGLSSGLSGLEAFNEDLLSSEE